MHYGKPDDSVLMTVRDAVGLEKDDDSFDTELIIYINGAISELLQAGVGNEVIVTGEDTKWSDLVVNDSGSVSMKLVGLAIMYVFLNVKVHFDPPQVNTQNVMVEAMNQAIWRLAVAWDEEYYDRSKDKGGENDES